MLANYLKDTEVLDLRNDLLYPSLYSDAKSLMEKFQTDIPHCEHVFASAYQIMTYAFPEPKLVDEPQLHPYWQRLGLAALLHDIGHYVATKGHHKHSRYLIENAEELGTLDSHLIQDVAVLSMSHRKRAKPDWLEERFFGNIILFQLGAILRLADGLDHSHQGKVRIHNGFTDKEQFVLEVTGLRKPEYEIIMMKKADAWKLAFHQSLELRILPSP